MNKNSLGNKIRMPSLPSVNVRRLTCEEVKIYYPQNKIHYKYMK